MSEECGCDGTVKFDRDFGTVDYCTACKERIDRIAPHLIVPPTVVRRA